jgi:hypothetical protein
MMKFLSLFTKRFFKPLVPPNALNDDSISLPPYTVHGEEPSISGQTCTALVAEFLCNGLEVLDQINMVYLKFDAQWYTLYFEPYNIFWRLTNDEHLERLNLPPELYTCLKDLSEEYSVVGYVAKSIEVSANEAGDMEVFINFISGNFFKIKYLVDSDSSQVLTN